MKMSSFENLEQVLEFLKNELARKDEKLEAVNKNIKQFKMVLELMTDGLVVQDRHGHIAHTNHRFADLLGYKIEDLIDRPLMDIVHPEDRRAVHLYIKRTLYEKSVNASFTFRAVTKDNRPMRLNIRAIQSDWHNRTATLWFVNNISKTNPSETIFKKDLELFRTLFDTNPIWTVLATVKEGRYIEANPAFFQKTGYVEQNVIGRTSTEFGLWPDPKDRAVVLRKLKEDGRLASLPIQFRMSNGELHDFVWSARIVEFDSEPCTLSGLIDITRQKHSEEALIEKQETIFRQANQIQDLNTTLKTLLGHRKQEQNDQYKALLESLKKSVLPYLSKVKSGRVDNVSRTYLSIIESNINNLLSSQSRTRANQLQNLTITETQVADLICEGKTSKEIAAMLNVSTAAVSFHRHNLRKKLGLSKKKTSLVSYLRTITQKRHF